MFFYEWHAAKIFRRDDIDKVPFKFKISLLKDFAK